MRHMRHLLLSASNSISAFSLSSMLQHPWEMVGHHINEGPIALQRENRLFITYSASLDMTPDYCLGLLELNMVG